MALPCTHRAARVSKTGLYTGRALKASQRCDDSATACTIAVANSPVCVRVPESIGMFAGLNGGRWRA